MTTQISTLLPRAPRTFVYRLVCALTAVVGLAANAMGAQEPAAPASATPPVRIAVVMPKVDLGAANAGDSINGSVREAIASMLQGPTLDIVPLAAQLDALVRAEAANRGADFVLFTSLVRKAHKGGNLFTRAAQAAGPAAVLIPGGAAAGRIRATAASGAAVLASTVSGSTQEKDEFTLAYRLTGADATSARAAMTLTRKATRAGEDVLSPLLEEMGNAVLAAIAGGR